MFISYWFYTVSFDSDSTCFILLRFTRPDIAETRSDDISGYGVICRSESDSVICNDQSNNVGFLLL